MILKNYFTYKDEVSRTISWGHWFLFLNVFLALLVGCGYLYDSPKPSTGLGFFYLIISWLGHFSSIVFIVYLILLFPLSFIGSLKYYRILAVIISVISFLILLIDVKLYQSIKIHLNTSVLDLFIEQEGFSTGLNFNFLYIATPILIFIECFFSHLSWKHIYIHNNQKLTYFFTALFLISFFSTHLLHIWANAYKYVPITIQKTIFPAYYPMTANTFLAEHGWIKTNTSETIERTNNTNHKTLNYPLEIIKVTPKEYPSNVILILINGLNSKHLTSTYMPNLTNFASLNDSYLNHFLGSNNSYTNAFELTYGLPGQYQSLVQNQQTEPILISEMLQQEFKIRSFITANTAEKAKNYAKSNGIRSTTINSYKNDQEVIDKAINFIKSWDPARPQFTVLGLNSPETLEQLPGTPLPFVPQITTEEINQQIYPNSEQINNRYYNCLWNLDLQLNELLTTLKEDDKFKNTVVIITSIKGYSNPLNIKETYNRENYHVPLIIKWPNSVTSSKITALSSTQDIAPTLLQEILGVKNNVDTYSTGENLREITNRKWILSGDSSEIQIISTNQTTIFDKQGNSILFSSDENGTQTETPNMSTLIRAMKLLNKYKRDN